MDALPASTLASPAPLPPAAAASLDICHDEAAPPPFNVPLTLLAQAGPFGAVDLFHGFHDGETWYAYDLPASGAGWQVLAWQRGFAPCPPTLPAGVRLAMPAMLVPVCASLP